VPSRHADAAPHLCNPFFTSDAGRRLWDARSSRCMGTVKVTARPLFIAWKADGSELLCLDQSDIISVISAKTFKVVRKHKYGSQVRRAHR
jgi:hypothetical protein